MQLEFLGGADAIGRSALLVNDRLLLDYGLEGGTPPRTPPAVEPDAVVVSHGHLDHVGAVPSLLAGGRRPPVHWTPPTREFADLLARDTLKLQEGRFDRPFTTAEVGALGEVSRAHGYGESFEAAGHEVTFFDAGHIPGSAHVLVDDGETRLLYAGDYNTADQRLVNPSTARPEADVVVTESTYSDVEREPRSETEARFVEQTRETLHGGGTVVAPAFAVGRTQEVMLLAAAADVPTYVDGMGVEVARRLKRHTDFLRDGGAYGDAVGHARLLDASTTNGQRERIARENALIVTTSGMLNGGPALTYVPAVRANPQNAVFLTGHQVEGTPGRELLDRGRLPTRDRTYPVSARVEAFDFSAHADRPGLRSFLSSYRDAEVLVVHGDRTEAFASELREDGVDAASSDPGERVTVNHTTK